MNKYQKTYLVNKILADKETDIYEKIIQLWKAGKSISDIEGLLSVVLQFPENSIASLMTDMLTGNFKVKTI